MRSAACLFIIAVSSSLFADDAPSPPKNGDKGANQMFSDIKFHAHADFIYYYPSEEGLDIGYSYEGGNVIVDPNSPLLGGKGIGLDYKWQPGFVVGAGIEFTKQDPWDIFVNYLWLKEKATGSASMPPNGLLFPNWTTLSITNRSAGYISGQWNLFMQLLDVELARLFYPLKESRLRPFFGLRASWIDQKYDLLAEGLIQRSLGNNGTFVKSDSWGIGLRMGIDSDTKLYETFGMYTKVSGSLLYAKYDISETNTADTISTSGAFDYTAVINSSYLNAELMMGFFWYTTFYEDAAAFRLSLGYDFRVFFDQNMMRATQSAARAGLSKTIDSLFLQGLHLTGSLSF